MGFIVKVGVGRLPKHRGTKEFVICAILGELKVKITLLDFPSYTHITSDFKNICHTTNLLDLLTQENYGDRVPLSLIF